MTVHELSRRSALRGLAVTAGAAVVGYLVSRNSDAAQAKSVGTAANGYGATVETGGRRLAALAQVPSGGGLILGDEQIVLTKDATGSVHAFSAICTHQGCLVSSVSGGTINCPCHGSRFDANTGAVVAGPAPRPLPVVAVTVREGGIYPK
jgi:Rieske Fe-S protein